MGIFFEKWNFITALIGEEALEVFMSNVPIIDSVELQYSGSLIFSIFELQHFICNC